MKEILLYQDIDLKIKKIENEIATSDAKKNATEMQNLLRALQEKLSNLEEQAAAINSKYKKVEAGMVEANKKLEQIKAKAAKVKSDEADALIDVVNQMKNIMQTYDKEASALGKNAENISKDLENVMTKAKTAKKNLLYYREQYDALRASKSGELNELKSKLAAQEKKVEPKLLAKYLAKSTGKNSKVIVPLENGRCGGCKMEVAASGLAKLEKDKVMECENCGRIIYLD